MNSLFEHGILPKQDAKVLFDEVQKKLIDVYEEWCDKKNYPVVEVSHVVFDVVKTMEMAATMQHGNVQEEIKKMKKDMLVKNE